MFAKFKSGGGAQAPLESNPIGQSFEIGKQVASSGPELVWRIHDAYRKSDGKECSVFIFEKRSAEKLHKPKRKETVTELLRASVRQLERFRHPKVLHVLHSVEECGETLAFAAEPVYASLANILAFQEGVANQNLMQGGQQQQQQQQPRVMQREYNFLDIEYKYGILQITEALSFLHTSGHVLHRNVCPASILVTKKGTWKLAGLEFTETLRKHSPVVAIQRDCTRDCKLNGTDILIKKGTRIEIPIQGLHSDPEYFENPDIFDPERFSNENKAKIRPFTYIPFGEGPRICIGLRFGVMQAKTGLVAILRNYKVTLNEKTKMPIVLDPTSFLIRSIEGGLWLNVEAISS